MDVFLNSTGRHRDPPSTHPTEGINAGKCVSDFLFKSSF